MNALIDGYKKLYDDANIEKGYRFNKQYLKLDKLSHFPGMKGMNYDKQRIKLLVVGRAVNGWGSLNTESSSEFAYDAIDNLCNSSFSWVHYDIERGCLRNDGDYWLNTPFWNVIREVWKSISDNKDFVDSESDRWVDYIAWTNLYKVAPLDGGNPTTTMCKKQLAACKDLLMAEIEYFKPTHILFITGYKWWFDQFEGLFNRVFAEPKENKYLGEKKNEIFAETYTIDEADYKIVVACRPECRNQSAYVKDILFKFNLKSSK